MLGRSCKHAQQARKLYRMCRERAAGYYTELAWALGEMIVEIPYLLIQASLYSVITYFMIWFEINARARRPPCITPLQPIMLCYARHVLSHRPSSVQTPARPGLNHSFAE